MLDASAPATCPSSPRGRVLLVEDEPQIQQAYARVLRSVGFVVVQVTDGSGVTAAIEAGDFDVVLSDIGLPGMNGIEVLRAVRRYDQDLPVILMTAAGDLTGAVKAIEHGALRYLLKPVTPSVLQETALEAVKLRQVAKIKQRAFELYGREATRASDRLDLSARFDAALDSLHMAYQPIVGWSARNAFAYEALVRSGEPSLQRPDHLFTAAERLGRIFDVGRAIRRHVADTMSRAPTACVFVNLHARDLEDEELLSSSSPLSQFASRVVLEVTERASLGDIDDLRARFATLRRLGFRLAIDDLGAGYAGLSSFAQVQPEVVKLDMSLIRGVDIEPTKKKLVESMTRLCSELGIAVVAEGIETTSERDTLVATGCNLLQGYLFAKPGAPFPQIEPVTLRT